MTTHNSFEVELGKSDSALLIVGDLIEDTVDKTSTRCAVKEYAEREYKPTAFRHTRAVTYQTVTGRFRHPD